MSIAVTIVAKMGKTPELQNAGDEKKQFTRFSVASNKFVGDGKGDLDKRNGQTTAFKTTWMNITVFGKTAKYTCDRFSQGDTIIIKGELETNTYEKKDSNNNVIDANALGIQVVANSVEGPFRTIAKGENGDSHGEASNDQAPTNGNSGPSRQAAPSGRPATNGTSRPAAARQAPADDIPF